MKLVSFEVDSVLGPQQRIGALTDDNRIVDLQLAYRDKLLASGVTPSAATRISAALLPNDMTEYIEGGPASLDAGHEAHEWAGAKATRESSDGLSMTRAVGDTTLLPPIPRPPLLRDFMAFETHLKNIYPKMGREIPDEWYNIPVYYKGNPGSIAGHGAHVPIPSYADTLDYEFELAFVIGKGGNNIPPEEAMDHVIGFMIYNDFSAREIQAREMQVGLGPAKGKDFSSGHVFGPALVTLDELPNVYDLEMRFTINGEQVGVANSGSIHWRFEDMIAHASRDECLVPGEIFGTGTVGGGAGTETGRFLTRGDSIELTVDGLGILANTVI